MADNVNGKKISDLNQISDLKSTDLLIVETSDGTRKISATDLMQWISGNAAKAVNMIGDNVRYAKISQYGKKVQGTALVEGNAVSDMTAITISGIKYRKLMSCNTNIFGLATNEYRQIGVGEIGYYGGRYGNTDKTDVLAQYDGTVTNVLVALAASAKKWQVILHIDAE